MAVNKETLLQATLNKLRNAFNVENPNSIANKAWQSKLGNVATGFQRFAESPTSRINLGSRKYSYNKQDPLGIKALKVSHKIGTGVGEAVLTEPIKALTDIGRRYGEKLNGEDFKPASFSVRLGQNLREYGDNKKPFSNVGYRPGEGTWKIPLIKAKFPEFGLSESPITETGKLALGAVEPIATAMATPASILTYLGLTGALSGIGESLGGGKFGEGFTRGITNEAPRAATSAGFLKATNPITELGTGAKLIKYPLRSATEVLQGIGYDNLQGIDTNGLSVTIDALSPFAMDISKTAFDSLEGGVRTLKAQLLNLFGKKLRNKGGMFTTIEKYIKKTRPYRKHGNSVSGVFLGFTPEKDEDGKWRFRFNQDRAVLGLMLGAGINKIGNGKIDLKNLDESLNIKKGIVTDPATVTRIKDSIAEGKTILRAGTDSLGKPLTTEQRFSIRKAVQNSLEKIGEARPVKDYLVEDVTPKGYGLEVPENVSGATPGAVANVPGNTLSLERMSQLREQTEKIPQARQQLKRFLQQATKALKPPKVRSFDDIIPPEIEKEIISTGNAVSKKVNLLDWMRTPDRVLKKIGLKDASDTIRKAFDDYLEELPKNIDTVFKWYEEIGGSKESSQRLFKYLDGQKNIQLSKTEAKVANEIKDYLGNWADRLNLPKDKRIAHYITHIFEKDFIQKEFDPDIAKIISSKIPGSVYDPFLESRLGKQGYVEDVFRALDAYTKRATRKVYMDPALKQLKETGKDLDLGSWKYVKSYADKINLRPSQLDSYLDNLIKSIPGVGYKFGQRPTAHISRGLRQAVYRGALGGNISSAMRNLTQGVNTYAKLGEKYTAVGYIKALRGMVTGGDELAKNGVLNQKFIQDRKLSVFKGFLEKADSALWKMFDLAEKVNRGGAYYGAKARALDAGKTVSEAIKEGVEAARDTQFTFGSVDAPVAMQGDLVKLLTQFQSYNVKQAEFLGEMVQNKEWAGMVRWIGANLVLAKILKTTLGFDFSDTIPFYNEISGGESVIGNTPVFDLAGGATQAIAGTPDEYGSTPEGNVFQRLYENRDIRRNLPVFFPGGVQARKTVEGIGAVSRGYSETPSGRVRFPIKQTPGILMRGASFGQYSGKEARAYFDENRLPLGEKQSKDFKQAIGQDTKKYEVSSDVPTTAGGKVKLYVSAVGTQPFDTIRAAVTGQPIRKIRGNAVIVERQLGLGEDAGKPTEEDHMIPLWAGGQNNESNLNFLPKEVHAQKTAMETQLRTKLDSGEMNKREVQKAIKSWWRENSVEGVAIKHSDMENIVSGMEDNYDVTPTTALLSSKKTDNVSIYNEIISDRKEKKDLQNVKDKLKESGGATVYGEKILINDGGTIETIEVTPPPSKESEVKYAKWEEKAYKSASKVLDAEGLSTNDKSVIIEALGVSEEDATYYNLASETNRIKSIHVREEAKDILSRTGDRQKMLQSLIDMRKETAGKMVLTSGVINDLVDEGIITYGEGKTLKKVEWDTEGKTPTAKVTGRGKSAKLKKVKFVPMDVLKFKKTKLERLKYEPLSKVSIGTEDISVPDMKVPTLKQPKYKVRFNL